MISLSNLHLSEIGSRLTNKKCISYTNDYQVCLQAKSILGVWNHTAPTYILL